MRTQMAASAAPVPDTELIGKYSRPGPRYTSYPPVPHWREDYGHAHAELALADLGRRLRDPPQQRPVSLYFHIPFCEHRCTFCACNVVISRAHERGVEYVDALAHEMDLALKAMEVRGKAQPGVVQMHWGGGTPTWLSADELALLHDRVAERFEMLPGREQSIEVDPRVTTREQLAALAERGLNRVSMGVQDVNEDVQRSIHRTQSIEQTASTIEHARSLGVAGINADLVYGLPHQTPNGFARTVDVIAALDVDRVALYNFAYLPERLRHQRAIKPEWLPDPEARIELFRTAHERFAAAGYAMIGLDHFARPGDELTAALADGSLKRNFMGYTTRAGHDLLSFGVSSISRIGRDFLQNAKDTNIYQAALANSRLPAVLGITLSDEDLLRESVIHDIMCFGQVDFAVREGGEDLLDARTRVQLDELAGDGLVEMEGQRLRVTPLGRFFLRNVAMVFDTYLTQAPVPSITHDGKPVQVRFSTTV